APLAQPVRRPQGRRGQKAPGAGGRERPPQAPRRRAGPGQADAPGGRAKKVVTADQRRQAVRCLQERFGVAQRRACRVLGQPRSTQRQAKKTREEEARLGSRMLELGGQHPPYGYRRIWALLRREGWRVNRKRVYRLWRQQGLRVPRKQRKKRRLGSSANGCVRRPAQYRDHVWAWDFLHDRTSDGGPLKWLTLVDEYTRECLALEVGRGMTARGVIGVLAGVGRQRGGARHSPSGKRPRV